jgi:hypothetical protein
MNGASGGFEWCQCIMLQRCQKSRDPKTIIHVMLLYRCMVFN